MSGTPSPGSGVSTDASSACVYGWRGVRNSDSVSACSTTLPTGGVERDEMGLYAPVGDPDWVDLGEAYLDACLALDRLPKLAKEEE